jgi:hypothetical protein
MGLQKIGAMDVDWIDLEQKRHLSVSCEHGNEHLGSKRAMILSTS